MPPSAAKARRPGSSAVSYTHLDVYKRQLLTNAGHDRAARVGAVVADVERRADEGIDPDDLATFYKVLDQLTRNLEAVDADPAEAFEPLEIQ